MKKLKKLTSLLLALMIVLSFAACSKDDDKKDDEIESKSKTTAVDSKDIDSYSSNDSQTFSSSNSDAKKVAEYVRDNKELFESQFESSFSSSSGGIGCDCIIETSGTTIIINCNIDGIDNLTPDERAVFKEAYSQMGSISDSMLDAFQTDVPEVTDVIMNICEEDGDIITSI